jgi:NAD(P)H-flavin reductase
VTGRHREASDVVTLAMEPVSADPLRYRSGQFNMLTILGVGESAISVSSAPSHLGPIEHTVRDVGPVTRALCATGVGGLIGVRGPFGTDWGVHQLTTRDVVVVAGGIGLAPLRGAVSELVGASRPDRRRVYILVGARQPDQIIFSEDIRAWSGTGAHVSVTVDVGAPGWAGHVGLVTSLLTEAGFDPRDTTALMCGPEIMMRFTARQLVDMGVDPACIRVSIERNMQCGVGWCGHCQVGPLLVCRDGPVLPYAGQVAALLTERER